jgi:hypothetical protein
MKAAVLFMVNFNEFAEDELVVKICSFSLCQISDG